MRTQPDGSRSVSPIEHERPYLAGRDEIAALVEQIRGGQLPKIKLKKLVLKAVRHLPGHQRNAVRHQVAEGLGFQSWKELSDKWPR